RCPIIRSSRSGSTSCALGSSSGQGAPSMLVKQPERSSLSPLSIYRDARQLILGRLVRHATNVSTCPARRRMHMTLMRKLLAMFLVVMLAGEAAAREVEGVTLPDQVSIAGTTLTMNGMGVRTKFFVKAYVAAFYLQTPTHDANAAVTSNQPKRMQLVL